MRKSRTQKKIGNARKLEYQHALTINKSEENTKYLTGQTNRYIDICKPEILPNFFYFLI